MNLFIYYFHVSRHSFLHIKHNIPNPFIFTVAQPKAFEICEAFEELAFKKVVLNAGKLHGVVEGEYDVYAPELQLTGKETKDQLSPLVIGGYWVDRIIINQPDIGMLKSRGTAVYKREERGARVSTFMLSRRSVKSYTVNGLNPGVSVDCLA